MTDSTMASRPEQWQRDLVPAILNGETVWVHSDLELDPVAAHVLDLFPRGAAAKCAIPSTFDRTYEDYRHTLLAALRINEGEQRRIAELELGIRNALQYLGSVRETVSLSEAVGNAAAADEILMRVL